VQQLKERISGAPVLATQLAALYAFRCRDALAMPVAYHFAVDDSHIMILDTIL